MKKSRPILHYLFFIGGLVFVGWWLINKGKGIENLNITAQNITSAVQVSAFDGIIKNMLHPLSLLILQIMFIVVISRIIGLLFKRIGQPTVMGEILAGILIGPTLLGTVAPEFTNFLFAKESLPNLHLFSQFGIIFFMFVIGMELDTSLWRRSAFKAVTISHSSIALSFALGIFLSYSFIFKKFAPPGVSFMAFSLFLGISMSITAFPVLGRIVQERGLTRSPRGTLAITVAAVDDVTAWTLLAVIIAVIKAGSIQSALVTILLTFAHIIFMFYVVKPLMSRLGSVYTGREMLNKTVVATVFLVLLFSSIMTELIGIHAFFGAFLAGVIMPEGSNLKRIMIEKIEDLALVLLLPLFFVFTGLRTKIMLFGNPDMWNACLWVIIMAITGKFGGSAFTAKILGLNWKSSISLGVLMNTRGLMELVVLNIGYDMGVLSSEAFSVMVVMTLVTTFMAGPALSLVDKLIPEAKKVKRSEKHTILMAFGKPEMGRHLLRLSAILTGKERDHTNFISMHISPHYDILPSEAEVFEYESFRLVKQESAAMKIPVNTYFKASEDVSGEIINYSNTQVADMLIVGAAQPLFGQNILGGKIGRILEESQSDTLVFCDHGTRKIQNVLTVLDNAEERFLLNYVDLLKRNSNLSSDILDYTGEFAFSDSSPVRNVIASEDAGLFVDEYDFLNGYDLLLVSKDKWRQMVINYQLKPENLKPSILVISQGANVNRLLNTEYNAD
ncbi:MAG: cation:proton antiporter [Bacteroidota bacterium]|nr:cation:proton antiporter [Bacteroidota bacterium]